MTNKRSGYTRLREQRLRARATATRRTSSSRSPRPSTRSNRSSANFRSVSSSSAKRRNMRKYFPSHTRNIAAMLHENPEPSLNLLKRHHTA